MTSNVNVFSGSTLNLGANLSLTGTLDVENTGSVLNMNGFNISAPTILLGQFGLQSVTLDRGTPPGSLTATDLYVAVNTFNLLASDNVTNFHLNNATTTLNSGVAVSFLDLIAGSTATTTTSGNITDLVNVHSEARSLILGANLSITGGLDVDGASTILLAHGFNITCRPGDCGLLRHGSSERDRTSAWRTFRRCIVGHGSSVDHRWRHRCSSSDQRLAAARL